MDDVTGGELLVRCLANEGVRFVFGLPCPEVDPILASLEAHGLRLVPIRHEAAAVHMAEGLYKTTGQVAAVLGNPGPGSANLLPGVITARHEGVPVLIITAQHRLGIVYPSTPSTFQGQDQLDVFRPTVKWGGPIFEWSRIPELTALAFREMWCGRPGPVQLEIPAPVMYATGDAAQVALVPSGLARCRLRPPTQLRAAAELLRAAERPRRRGQRARPRRRKCRARAASSRMPGRHDDGGPFVVSDRPPALAPATDRRPMPRREADVVCVLGSRLGNLDLPYDKYWGDRTRQKIIHIDVDPRHIGVTRPVTIGIVADLASALPGLLDALRALGIAARRSHDTTRYAETERQWRDTILAGVAAWAGPGIHPAHAMQVVGETFGRDAVRDRRRQHVAPHSCLPPTAPRSTTAFSSSACSVPAFVGDRRQLGAPDREVVCVTGDGAAGTTS
jgi:acetolactate synthase-1/2/3 large subunit